MALAISKWAQDKEKQKEVLATRIITRATSHNIVTAASLCLQGPSRGRKVTEASTC